MAMYDEEFMNWTDRDLVDSTGDKIGKVDGLYYDETTGQPEWLLVKTGLFGTKKTFVPADQVHVSGDHLMTSLSKDRVKDAPSIDDEEMVNDDDQRQLYSYYGMTYRPLGKLWRSSMRRAA
jgi:hypothetical protein